MKLEELVQKALAKLEAANQKVKFLEESSSKARAGEGSVSDIPSNILDYTRLKIVSGDAANIAVVANNPEAFVRNIEERLSPDSRSRSRTPQRIPDECCEQAESSRRRSFKEKERYLSGRGLLRGPFP
eukprot:TRINITY_DN2845_c0_g1_i1.p1 TRINITY_DN2845_c0_g1~~TRINITY_DN2845_c0_g1_i1.p1  ORF type:complete len:128 (-),score=21.80 TRINITY_DN2845_c0_g1_i1:269-652(-)